MHYTSAALIEQLKQAEQDFEFYPTTNEIIGAMVKDLKAIRFITHGEGEFRHRWHEERKYESLLDIGAGHGKTLEKIREYYNRSCGETSHAFGKLYAIEKSPILCEGLDPSIFIVGTEFEQQSLLTKQVDVIFSNPPYSIFADWTVKILREAAAPLVYLVIPQRWQDSAPIADVLRYRNAEAHIVGDFDFEHAEERTARAKVHLLRIDLSKDKDSAFEKFFDAEFADLKAKWEYDDEKGKADTRRKSDEDKADEENRRKFGHLVVGPTYPEAMVSLYNDEMAKIRRNYSMVGELDRDLMVELGISPSKVMACLKERLATLKNVYWKEIFDHLHAITDRLTTKRRRELLGTLNSYCHVDFTLGNIHAVVIWVLKNANEHLDLQLLETFDTMVDKANVRNYVSNTRPFVHDRWRYKEEKPTHFCLEYRMVLHWLGGIHTSWSGRSELEERACDFLLDLHTVARNLGYQCDTADDRLLGRRDEWKSNKLVTFYYKPKRKVGDRVNMGSEDKQKWRTITEVVSLKEGGWQYKVDGEWYHYRIFLGDILCQVRAFKNRNVHIRLNQRFALALNVEVGRLRGWLRSAEEAVKETGDPEAASVFRTHLCLPTSGSNLMALMAPEAPTPAAPAAEEENPEAETEAPLEVVPPDECPNFPAGVKCDCSYCAQFAPPEDTSLQGKFSQTDPVFQIRLQEISTEGGLPVLEVFTIWREYCATAADQSKIVDEFRDWYAARLGLKTRAGRDADKRAEGDAITAGATDNTPSNSSHEPPLEDMPTRFNPLTSTTAAAVAIATPAPKPKRTAADRRAAPAGNFREAAVLLHSYTGHTGDFWRLMGPANVGARQQIMSKLMGRKVAQKDCGITVIRDLFHDHIGAAQWERTCDADRDAKFAVWLNDFIAGKAPETNVPTPTRPEDYSAEPMHGGHVTVEAAAHGTSGGRSKGESNHVTVTQPPGAPRTLLAQTAQRVPPATYAAMLAGDDGDAAEIDGDEARRMFVVWCDENDTFADWRAAFAAFRELLSHNLSTHTATTPLIEATIPVAEPRKIVPFVALAESCHPFRTSAELDPIAAALAGLS